MQSFDLTSPGVLDTWQTLFTGDVQARGVCVSYDYFSCCEYGMEIRISRTTISGGSASDVTFYTGSVSDCFQSSDGDTISFSGDYRITAVELRIYRADDCPVDTPVDFKLAMDASCQGNSSSEYCSVDFDPIRLV
jgi:hypothetical protein